MSTTLYLSAGLAFAGAIAGYVALRGETDLWTRVLRLMYLAAMVSFCTYYVVSIFEGVRAVELFPGWRPINSAALIVCFISWIARDVIAITRQRDK